jgi:hypothetical protein
LSLSLSLSLSSSVSTPNPISGLCSIKQKIKEYDDTTEIEWLVRPDFLRKMKRVHMYFAPLMPQPIIPNTNICDDTHDE